MKNSLVSSQGNNLLVVRPTVIVNPFDTDCGNRQVSTAEKVFLINMLKFMATPPQIEHEVKESVTNYFKG